MRFRPIGALLTTACVVALMGGRSPLAQSAPGHHYTIEDLSIPGAGDSYADAIDLWGTVVGVTIGGGERAFRFDGGASVHLDTIGATLGGPRSYGLGVYSRRITGWSNPVGGATARGFIYDGESARDIGTLGGAHTFPQDINASGWIAGVSSLPSGDEHAFLFDGASLLDLGTFGGRFSYAYALNDSGWVTGGAFYSEFSAQHAFLFDGGRMRDLGTLGGRHSVGRAINGEGKITGYAQTAGGVAHAFLYDGAVMRDLGTLGGNASEGFGVNNYDYVVGESSVAAGATHAFVYRDGHMLDLNTLIDPTLGWTLVGARSINDAGQIVGQ